MRLIKTSRRLRGFTLIEVMVALIIIAIGMLGIAKLQGLALSNTSVSSMRSLAAIQATSLAVNMHANRAFWTNAPTTPATTLQFTNVHNTSSDSNNFTVGAGNLALVNAPCVNSACTNLQIAEYDVYQWISSLNQTLPNATETVTCQSSTTQPVACTIQITWTENMQSANNQEAQVAATTATQTIANPTYQLYVVP